MSDRQGDPRSGLPRRMMAVVEMLQRHAVLVLAGAVLLTVVCGIYAARNFTIDTDLNSLLSPDLPFQRDAAELARAFPQLDNTIVAVIDGPTPAMARDAARRLAESLVSERTLFSDVYRPEGDFFAHNGLLYLDPTALQEMLSRLVGAQPLVATLAANPTVGGLAMLIQQAAGPQAAAAGVALSGLDQLLAQLADSVQAVDQGRFRPVAWSRLMSSGERDTRQYVIVQPRLDTASLSPAGAAMAAIRGAAADLNLDEVHGFRLRLTGSAALSESQIQGASEGASGAALLCFGLMAILLAIGLYSLRMALGILLMLTMSFVWSVAFGVAVVGAFNPISVAFAVLFIGLGADFGIQFSVRYGEDLAMLGRRLPAVRSAFLGAWKPLALAATAAAISFYSTIPTSYVGLADLGIIAGTSMWIAVLATLFLLPAYFSLIPAGRRHTTQSRYGGFGRLALHRHRHFIVGAAIVAGLAALPFAVTVGFDFDPARVQDPRAEAVQAMEEMRRSDAASLYTIDILTPNLAAANAMTEKLSGLESVSHAVTLSAFVPEQQEVNRAAIEQVAMLIPPFSLTPADTTRLSPAEIRNALDQMRQALANAPPNADYAEAAGRLARALDDFLTRHGSDDAALERLADQLVGDLPQTLDALRRALMPEPITLESLPADLKARYVNPKTGEARVEVFSSIDLNQPGNLTRFVDEVQSVAPRATGASVSVVETGRAVANAFRISTALALVGIFALLFLVLRNVGRALLVLVPLILAAILTMATMNALDITFNLGNVIVLPLLIGLGVAFGIYFVLRWSEGAALDAVLRTSMPDAVLLSGLATMVSFGSMALSGNAAMASLGRTLSIALFYVLVCVLIVLPALLAFFGGRTRDDAAGSDRPSSR